MTNSKHSNSGLLVLRDGDDSLEKTVIIIGLARGGTTMVMGFLEQLGVAVPGVKKRGVVLENMSLSKLIEGGEGDRLEEIVQRFNEQHPVWGFKRPNIASKMMEHEKYFRNPHYVFIYKDILSIAVRNQIAAYKDPLQDLQDSIELQSQMLELAKKTDKPVLMISYDKILRNPADFAQPIADFVGTDVGEEQIRNACKFVTPNYEAYNDATRIDSFFGSIGQCTENGVKGWVKYRSSNNPLNVILEINNEVAGEMRADIFRQDVKDAGFFNGEYGFEFSFSEPLAPGSKVALFINDKRRQEIKGSPAIV